MWRSVYKESWYNHDTSGHKQEHFSTATLTTTTVLNGCISDKRSNVSKAEKEQQENNSYQYEQEQECDGDEVFAGKKRRMTRTNTSKNRNAMEMKCLQSRERKRWYLRNLLQLRDERKGHTADAGRTEREKEAGETRKEKVDPKEMDGLKENGQTKVTRGTLLGTIHIGTGKRTRLQMDPWSAVESSLCSQFEPKLRGVFCTDTHAERNTHQNVAVWKPKEFRSREQILNFCA